MDITGKLSFFAALYKVADNPETGMWWLYLTIVFLSIIVYKLGFATKLPLLKSILIYIFLALGCTILTFLGAFLPVAEGLVVAALILIIYKVRLHNQKKQDANLN
jgi:CHASE2 domain-containing sensor protein